MAKSISPNALVALKDALAKIYWYKKDLKAFVSYSMRNNAIISTIDWDGNNKYEAVSQLVDRMSRRSDIYLDDLMMLIRNVCDFSTYDHFDKLTDKDAVKLKSDAKTAVNALRRNCEGYFDGLAAKEKAEAQKASFTLQQSKTQDYHNKIEAFKSQYYALASMADTQRRGYAFESFLNDLFFFFDLSPRSSFKIYGEQIDGAFTHNNKDYLLEAKWHSAPIDRGEIDVFEAKISRKLKTTLGLFISVNGFAETVTSNASTSKSVILMDSQDLIQVLEDRITLPDLMLLKRRHAAETGEIMYRVNA